MQVGLLRDPCLRCVERVADEMQRVAEACANKMSRFPVLRARLLEVVKDMFEKMVPQLYSYINNTISIHQSFVNTVHPDFFEGGTNLSHLSAQMQVLPPLALLLIQFFFSFPLLSLVLLSFSFLFCFLTQFPLQFAVSGSFIQTVLQ